MIKIMLVDDHPIVRQGMVSLIESMKDFVVVAEAGTGAAAMRLAADLRPDVIIMDMLLPDIDGIKVAKAIKESGVESEIIFLTMHSDARLRETAQMIGVRGYLLKNDSMEDLLYAIKAVLRGERFTSGSLNADASSELNCCSEPLLTRRETEIIALIAEGMGTRDIAEKLFISVKTVESHRRHIIEKLELRCTADIVRYALKSGLAN